MSLSLGSFNHQATLCVPMGSEPSWSQASRGESAPCTSRAPHRFVVTLAAMTVPHVSVVIPTRNRLPLLREAVESVLGQRGIEVECIVVDDHSDDGTHEWLSTIDDARFSFVRLEEHAERTVARNTGLRRTRGPFVLFLDDDDTLPPWALQQQVACLQASPDAVFCMGRHLHTGESGTQRLVPLPRVRHPLPFLRAAVLGVTFPPGLYRKAIVEDVGGWNEEMTVAEDQDLLMRVALKGPLVLVPQVTYINRSHEGQERSRDDSVPAGEARQRLRQTAGVRFAERIDRYACVRTRLFESYDSYQAGHAFRAFGHALSAVSKDPGILVDPLTRRGVWIYMFRCSVRSVPGSYAAARAARLTADSRNDP